MICAGLDIGSRTTVLVVREQSGKVSDSIIVETGANPLRRCQQLLVNKAFDRLVATGYGRHLAASTLGCEFVSEIRAYGTAAGWLYPDCRTVVDMGGQDSKVISLDVEGRVQKFEMNDRCAAGTGKFLEIMANTLEVHVSELGKLASSASKTLRINSLCTVFAESEVVSLISRGEETGAIALALHEAIANRLANMVKRIGPRERIVFAGGGALNQCLVRLLGERLGLEITVPPDPQLLGALGAAILGGNAPVT